MVPPPVAAVPLLPPEPVCTTQGGTMIFVMLLLLGSSSAFWGWPPLCWAAPWGDSVPPGLSRTVLARPAVLAPWMQG